MRYLKIIVGVLVIIVGVIFVLQNKDLQRPIKLGFDPLYMFKSHQAAPPAPPAPVTTDQAPAPAGDSAAEEKTAVEASAGGKDASAPQAPAAPARPAQAPDEGAKGIPAFILIFLAFFAGILVASLFGIMEKYRLKRVVKSGASRIRDLEEELKKIRNLPLTQPTTQAIITPPPSLAEPMEVPDEPASEEDRANKEEG